MDKYRKGAIVVIAMIIASLILTIWLPILQSFRIVFGSVFVLFLPGFVWTYVFFKKQERLERIALSFALSIAIVPLLVFYANLLGMPINGWSVSAVVALVIVSGFLIHQIPKAKELSRRQAIR
jgi:uncharacterized membrane protein